MVTKKRKGKIKTINLNFLDDAYRLLKNVENRKNMARKENSSITINLVNRQFKWYELVEKMLRTMGEWETKIYEYKNGDDHISNGSHI